MKKVFIIFICIAISFVLFSCDSSQDDYIYELETRNEELVGKVEELENTISLMEDNPGDYFEDYVPKEKIKEAVNEVESIYENKFFDLKSYFEATADELYYAGYQEASNFVWDRIDSYFN